MFIQAFCAQLNANARSHADALAMPRHCNVAACRPNATLYTLHATRRAKHWYATLKLTGKQIHRKRIPFTVCRCAVASLKWYELRTITRESLNRSPVWYVNTVRPLNEIFYHTHRPCIQLKLSKYNFVLYRSYVVCTSVFIHIA